MARVPHRRHDAGRGPTSPTDDSGSFGGLADVLEPDADSVTSVRPIPVAPARVQDFAFADTVFADELPDEGAPPPSGPIFARDPMGNTQCVTPLAFRLPPPGDDVDLPTRLRVLFAHARHAVRASLEEMSGLWAHTDKLVDRYDVGPKRHLRRVLALWSFFQWSRADLTRAAMIGVAVFIVAAAIGASTMDFGGDNSAASSAEVRAGRTLDQHTGKKFVWRSKR
jgi:hypothetical protein